MTFSENNFWEDLLELKILISFILAILLRPTLGSLSTICKNVAAVFIVVVLLGVSGPTMEITIGIYRFTIFAGIKKNGKILC